MEAPIKNPGSIGTVERYHAAHGPTYEKIRKEMSRNFTDKDCSDMAIFYINSTVGPKRLCSMLLVFGLIPRPARKTPSEARIAWTAMIGPTMNEISKVHPNTIVEFVLRI